MESYFSEWVSNHDDSWLFIGLYVGLAVILSIAISLFWLVAVVFVHGILEWFALRKRGVESGRLAVALWHIKLDIGLVIFALWIGVYMDVLFGLVGLGALARAGAQTAARAVSWQQVIRGFLLTVDDMAQVARAVAAKKTGNETEVDHAVDDGVVTSRPWQAALSGGDRVAIMMIVIFSVLILAAPLLTDHTIATTLQAVAHDLHPWP